MADIFDYPVLLETEILRELVEELEGTLLVIAYAGHETNIPFIRARQQYFGERYGERMEHVKTAVGIFQVWPAYDHFQHLLDDNPAPDQIARECEECLEEYLTPREPIEGYVEELDLVFA